MSATGAVVAIFLFCVLAYCLMPLWFALARLVKWLTSGSARNDNSAFDEHLREIEKYPAAEAQAELARRRRRDNV